MIKYFLSLKKADEEINMDSSKKDKREYMPTILKVENKEIEEPVKENYIMQTNIKNPISIEGVALGTAERSGIQKYFLMYKLYNVSERTEVNEETYNFVQSLFNLILNDKKGDLEGYINSNNDL